MLPDRAAPIRILIAARQPVVRAGLAGLLGAREEVELIGAVRSAAEAEETLREAPTDLVLAGWLEAEWVELTALAEHSAEQAIPLLVLASAPSSRELGALLRAGVRGVIRSDAGAEEIIAAARAAVQGLLVLEPGMGSLLTATPVSTLSDDGEIAEALTERELQVLHLMAVGLPNKTIASRLGISEHTVKFHVGSILGKLGVSSRTEAVTHAARRGLLML